MREVARGQEAAHEDVRGAVSADTSEEEEMSETEIRARHEEIVGMKSTMSTEIMRERGSRAHHDRGVLLAVIKDLREQNAALIGELGEMRAESSQKEPEKAPVKAKTKAKRAKKL
jgi:hypothetical protein